MMMMHQELGTRRKQLIRLVEEQYICPVYGSLVSLDLLDMMGNKTNVNVVLASR